MLRSDQKMCTGLCVQCVFLCVCMCFFMIGEREWEQ